MGQPQKALKYYQQALIIDRKTGRNEWLEANLLNWMGDVYADQRQTQKALDYYGRSLSLSRKSGYTGCQASSLHCIGTVYKKAGEPRMALQHYRRALALRRSGDHGAKKEYEIDTLTNIGDVEAIRHDLPSAATHYDQAIALTERF